MTGRCDCGEYLAPNSEVYCPRCLGVFWERLWIELGLDDDDDDASPVVISLPSIGRLLVPDDDRIPRAVARFK